MNIRLSLLLVSMLGLQALQAAQPSMSTSAETSSASTDALQKQSEAAVKPLEALAITQPVTASAAPRTPSPARADDEKMEVSPTAANSENDAEKRKADAPVAGEPNAKRQRTDAATQPVDAGKDSSAAITVASAPVAAVVPVPSVAATATSALKELVVAQHVAAAQPESTGLLATVRDIAGKNKVNQKDLARGIADLGTATLAEIGNARDALKFEMRVRTAELVTELNGVKTDVKQSAAGTNQLINQRVDELNTALGGVRKEVDGHTVAIRDVQSELKAANETLKKGLTKEDYEKAAAEFEARVKAQMEKEHAALKEAQAKEALVLKAELKEAAKNAAAAREAIDAIRNRGRFANDIERAKAIFADPSVLCFCAVFLLTELYTDGWTFGFSLLMGGVVGGVSFVYRAHNRLKQVPLFGLVYSGFWGLLGQCCSRMNYSNEQVIERAD